jgi:hypothetical protein
MLAWQFDRLQALAAFLSNPSWFWQNDEIIEHLKKLMAIDPDDIRAHLGSHNAEIVAYIGETYSHLYG